MVYEWTDAGGIMGNDGPTMIFLVFKIINPAKKIGVSNQKYEIEKENLAKFLNIEKDLLDEMSSNC